MNDCEIIFVSVPTPMDKDGSCHLGIVKSVLNDLQNISYGGFIVLRSTVPVGTSDELKCYFMPPQINKIYLRLWKRQNAR